MIDLQLDDRKIKRVLRAKVKKHRDVRPALLKIQHYIVARIGLQFARLSKGGRFRGVRWPDLQGRPGKRVGFGYSTRGGAFGGYRTGVYSDVATHQLRGGARTSGEQTLGALRPSGKRITNDSSVMQDTGTLLRKAGKWISRLTRNEIQFGTNLSYAAAQDELRPFMFFQIPRDLNEARRICIRHFRVE